MPTCPDADPELRALDRRQWMALLARAPLELLNERLSAYWPAAPHWLRPAQTGLLMVQARIGGDGARFNLGEVTVTRCALRLQPSATSSATVGVAYVLGRSTRRAQLAALGDALLQNAGIRRALEIDLVEPIRSHLCEVAGSRRTRAQATRVEFFTLARDP